MPQLTINQGNQICYERYVLGCVTFTISLDLYPEDQVHIASPEKARVQLWTNLPIEIENEGGQTIMEEKGEFPWQSIELQSKCGESQSQHSSVRRLYSVTVPCIRTGCFEYTARALFRSPGSSEWYIHWAAGFQENGTVNVLPARLFYPNKDQVLVSAEEERLNDAFVYHTFQWLPSIQKAAHGSVIATSEFYSAIIYSLAIVCAELSLLWVSPTVISRVCDVLLGGDVLQCQCTLKKILERRLPEIEVNRLMSSLVSDTHVLIMSPNVKLSPGQGLNVANKNSASIADSQCDESVGSSLLTLSLGREADGYAVCLLGALDHSVEGLMVRSEHDTAFLEVLLGLVRRCHSSVLQPRFANEVITYLQYPDIAAVQKIYLMHILRGLYDVSATFSSTDCFTTKLLELVCHALTEFIEHYKNLRGTQLSEPEEVTDTTDHRGSMRKLTIKELLSFVIYVLTGQSGRLDDSTMRSRVRQNRKSSRECSRSSRATRSCLSEQNSRRLIQTLLYGLTHLNSSLCEEYSLFTQCATAVITGNISFGRQMVDKMLRCFPRTDSGQQLSFIQLLSKTVNHWAKDTTGEEGTSASQGASCSSPSEVARLSGHNLLKRFAQRLAKCASSSHISVALEAVTACNPHESGTYLPYWLMTNSAVYGPVVRMLKSAECQSHWHRLVQHKAQVASDELEKQLYGSALESKEGSEPTVDGSKSCSHSNTEDCESMSSLLRDNAALIVH